MRDDGLDLRQFQKEVVLRLRELLLVQSGADGGGAWTPEQVAEMRAAIEGVPHDDDGARAAGVRHGGPAADPLSPLPLELALAESIAGACAGRRAREPKRAPRPRRTHHRRGAPQQSPARGIAARDSQRRARRSPPRPSACRRNCGKDLSNASAEDIAAMLGSKAPVIPPAAERAARSAPAAAATNGAAHHAIEPLPAPRAARRRSWRAFVPRAADSWRGRGASSSTRCSTASCEAVSWQDGVLTLGFYEDTFHKKSVEEAANRRMYEELAARDPGGAGVDPMYHCAENRRSR